MRDAFAKEMEMIAAEDPKVVLLSGDIGNRMFDRFKERFPDRFYNCGVAEANMMSMAAGLAMMGLKPVVYTIASFLLYRPYEQIRLDIAYQGLPVLLVGVGGGLGYASNGPSHHAVEDFAVMGSIPGMTLMSAADPIEVRLGLRALMKHGGPAYLRIGKKGEPDFHARPPDGFAVGRALEVLPDDRASLALLCTGTMLGIAAEVCHWLRNQGQATCLQHHPSMRPFDFDALKKLSPRCGKIVTIEEHSVRGGLGSVVAEWIAECAPGKRLLRIGTPDAFIRRTTECEDARCQNGLTADSILERINAFLKCHESGN
jgi:transketolase